MAFGALLTPRMGICVLVFWLSACGFQLRGSYALPEQYQQLQLQSGDPYSAITRQISQRLKHSGVKLVEDSTQPKLIIGQEKLERTNLSLYPDGQVAEYRFIYKLNVTLIEVDQPPQNLHLLVQRDYQDDPNQALAKRREMEVLLTEMRQQAADQLLLKLATL